MLPRPLTKLRPNSNQTLQSHLTNSFQTNPNPTLDHFLQSHRANRPIPDFALSSVLNLSDLSLGRQLHSLFIRSRAAAAPTVGASLVDLYVKSGDFEDGRKVFDRMPQRTVAAWTTLLTGYTQSGLHNQVLQLYFHMQVEGIKPNSFSLASFLAASAAQGAIKMGKRAHCLVIKLGYGSAVFVCSSLVSMYSKCGLIRDAVMVFEGMEMARDAVSWNAMIAGFVLNGLNFDAVRLFCEMRAAGMKPTQLSFVTVIKLCVNIDGIAFARQLHCCVIKEGFCLDVNIAIGLLVAYSKRSEMNDAFKLFLATSGARNVVSWTAMIGGFIQDGNADQAAQLVTEMMREGVEPNEFTYSTILTASPSMIPPSQIHCQIIKANYKHVPSVGTALLAAYTKLGNTREALSVFKAIDGKDIVTWSAMLAGFAQAGDAEGGIKLFKEMAREGVRPNEYTLSSAIDVSASPTANSDQGKQFHAIAIKNRYQEAICVSSALVTMYARKGSIESAQRVFDRQTERDLVSWNSMVSGYAQHGYAKKALEVFRKMKARRLELDGITFTGVITACTHAGLVEDGQRYFDAMVESHGISPTVEHYAGMVDLYSRAGKLEEAMELIEGMPFQASATVWRTLLGACRVHRNVELGKLVADKLISMEPQDSAAYVLLSNIYAAAGKWRERAKIRNLMDERKVKKEAGRSWIQIRDKVHSFLAADRSHPLSKRIYAKLEDMMVRVKKEGYQPDTQFVLHDMEEERKEAVLALHSERLAIAFGLMATPQGTPLQIVKNLRVCGDCHTVIKMVSKIEGREIVVRDSNRFHHFKGGSCSCGDYW